MLLLTRVPGALLPGSGPIARRLPARHTVLAVIAALALWGLSGATALAADSPVYRVRAGDTLTSVAARHGVSVAELVALNGLTNPNRLLAGQTLLLGNGTVAVRATIPAAPAPLIRAPYVRQFDGSIYA
ncbi:MAG: LysM peptidoglycan-binding domain-containing protein, partial [Chloroflexota bacterium]